jgi:hypothetical protein
MIATTLVLAERFSKLLSEAVGEKTLETIIRLNATEIPGTVCHSHDFLDANEVMSDAFTQVVGREPDTGNDEDARLWSAAWDAAQRAKFFKEPT